MISSIKFPTSGYDEKLPVTAARSVALTSMLEPSLQVIVNHNINPSRCVHAHGLVNQVLSCQDSVTDAQVAVEELRRSLGVAKWINECLPSTSLVQKTILPFIIMIMISPAKAMIVDEPIIYSLNNVIQVILFLMLTGILVKKGSIPYKLQFTIAFIGLIARVAAQENPEVAEAIPEFDPYALLYNLVWFIFLVVDICLPVTVILWFWHRDHDRSIYPYGAPIGNWLLVISTTAFWFMLPFSAFFAWFAVHALIYALCIPLSLVYFGLQAWWEWMRPTGTLLYTLTSYVPVNAPARIAVRPADGDPQFVEHRSQQRSIRKAIATQLVHIDLKYLNERIILCHDLVELCVLQFMRCTPTRAEINTFLMCQTQFNMTDLEWITHEMYVPAIVTWRIRVRKEEMAKFEQLAEELTDYDELAVRDKQRKYRLFLHSFLGARGCLTIGKIIASYVILGVGVFLMFRVVSATYMMVDKMVPTVGVANNHTMYLKDMRYLEQAAIKLEPALKPTKQDFHWNRKPTNETPKRTKLVSILSKEYMPLGLGYHYDRRDADNFTRAIEQRVAVTNVVAPLNFANAGDGQIHYQPHYAAMHREADALKELLKKKCNTPYVYPDRDVIVKWLESRHYPQERSRQILNAYDQAKSLMPRDLLRQKSGRVEAFIKEEYYPEFKNPRAILARGDLAKAILGPAFDQLNHVFFELPETVKKLPASARPEYIEKRCAGPYFYVTDHTAFECSATQEIQRHMEMRVYRDIMGKDMHKYLEILLQDQNVTVGNGSAYVPVSRFSGEMNTSLGNSITNYVFIKMIMAQFNVTGNFFIEGDDGLICLHQPLDVHQVERFAIENGFRLKIAQVDTPGSAGFLSTYWDQDMMPYKYPLGKYLAGSAWRLPQTRIAPIPLFIARLSSMIEENPKNDVLIALHKSFCRKYSLDCDTLHIYKPDDNYFREKLDLQNVSYERVGGMLRYKMPRYDYHQSGKEFLLEKYFLNHDRYDELMDKIQKNPEAAYSEVVLLFSHYLTSNTYIDYQLSW